VNKDFAFASYLHADHAMVPANITAQLLGGSLAVVFMSGTKIDTNYYYYNRL